MTPLYHNTYHQKNLAEWNQFIPSKHIKHMELKEATIFIN